MYTDNLRNKLKAYMEENSCTLYRIEKGTGVHRQCLKKLLNGSGVTYETGMKIRKFMKEEIKWINDDSFNIKPADNTTSSSE
jgi:hypothetical protein